MATYDLSVFLLGAPTFEQFGQPVSIQRRKSLALLAYLAVTRQPHQRDALATLFWPDSDQSSALANLRRDLSQLKNQLGDRVLLISREQLELNPEGAVYVDSIRFESLIEGVRRHEHNLQRPDGSLCPECRVSLQKAVNLYQGDFMEGFGLPDSPVFDEWQFFQTEGLRQKLAEALQHLIRWHSRPGEYRTAIEYARRWLALDTLHEPAHRQLMLLYALDGQQAAALRQYEECDRLLSEELGVEPEPETGELAEAIRQRKIGPEARELSWELQVQTMEAASDIGHPEAGLRHNLPASLTPFVGRKEEREEILRILLEEPDSRLLTLLGPGGSGKTRLAIQAGFDLIARDHIPFSDGVFFIPLAPLNDPDEIASAIRKTLNLSMATDGADPHQRLLAELRGRQMLLILDNFEQLATPDSAARIQEILSGSPQLKILITSRLRLNLQGEYLSPVSGLSMPSEEVSGTVPLEEDLPAGYSALEMFLQCARRVQPEFQITPQNYPAVAAICRQVQGMPLGIELAAAWLEMLTVEEIQAEIERSLDFLESEWQALPERQRSVRAVFNTSWNLLSAPARPVLKALSVFRAGFTRQAGQAVSGASTRIIMELMNKSWLQRRPDGRYEIHELLRQFAFEKLQAEEITFHHVKEQFCCFYANYLRTLWESHRGNIFNQVVVEYDNLSRAWAWLVELGQVRRAVEEMLPALFVHAEVRDKSHEILSLVNQVISLLETSPVSKPEERLLAILYTVQGAFYSNGFPVRLETFGMILEGDRQAVEKSWALAHSAGGPHRLGFWGVISAYLYGRMVSVHEAIEALHGMLPYFRNENRLWELAVGLLHLAMLVLTDMKNRPERDRVGDYLEEALQIFQGMGDEINSGYALRQRGNLDYQLQRLPEAIQHWQTAKTNFQSSGEWAIAANIDWQMGDTYLQLGNFEEAFRCYQEMTDTYLKKGHKRKAGAFLLKESEEAVRYGDLEDAMERNRRSLQLAEETGDEHTEAWCYWWMGEALRVAGDTAEARKQYERAHFLFEKLQESPGMTFYYHALGDLALAAGETVEARRLFTLSLDSARSRQHDWGMAYALSGLGRAETALNRMDAAQSIFSEALQWAKNTQERGIALVVLAGWAELLAASGRVERAVEVATIVAQHYASWRETRQQAAALLAAYSRSDYRPQAPVEGIDLWDVVKQVQADLPETT